MSTPTSTRHSLLMRLKDSTDTRSWDQFFNIYQGFIYRFARQLGCSEQTAQDVLQDTMITLTRVLPNFDYNQQKGRFRGYLMRIVKSRVIDAWRRESKIDSIPIHDHDGGPLVEYLSDDWHREWEKKWEKEWENHLLMEALSRVRKKIRPKAYQAFVLTVIEQKTTDEVTQLLGMQRNTLYQARKRVLAQVYTEVNAIRRELGE